MKKLISACMAGAVIVFCGCSRDDAPEKSAAPHQPAERQENSMCQDYVNFICGWDENPEELGKMASAQWESSCKCKIIYASEKIVSFKIESWSYTGGAHGMLDTKVGTVRNGEVLKLADLPADIKIRWAKALKALPEYNAIMEYAKSLNDGPKLTENFYIDAKGIHFIYNPYEINCFAAGTIDIFVPGKFE